jgi:uncharacterized protein (DUF427 family)
MRDASVGSRGKESVAAYPRPPALAPDDRHVIVTFAGTIVADTRRAIRVLETFHPPTWYLPVEDVRTEHLRPSTRTSVCEWKGAASYFDVVVGDAGSSDAAWCYLAPSPSYEALRDHVAFYAGRLHVTVDGEVVRPQPGGFYGGWITDDVIGPFKGGPGTRGW